MPSLLKTNLQLLHKQLETLSFTPFFNECLHTYVDDLLRITTVLKTDFDRFENHVVESLIGPIWDATHYLAGSATNTMPYEVVYGLEQALSDWVPDQFVITTAVTQDRNFHFSGVDESFYELAESLCGVTFSNEIVQVSLPTMYKHKPLYSVLLYHELGHFLDLRFNLSGFALLQAENARRPLPGLEEKPREWSTQQFEQAQQAHVREYFADLFAVMYLGWAVADYLDEFAQGDTACSTHPATSDRLDILAAALKEEEHPIVDDLKLAITTQDGVVIEDFTAKFTLPEIGEQFDDVRPCNLTSVAEVHGLLQVGRTYLRNAMRSRKSPWDEFAEEQVERVINDLVEKSIRNFIVRERWNSANSQ